MDTRKAVVLCADSGYMSQLETTIKSLCTHNQYLKIYIFNDDIPIEWFQLMERRLEVLHSTIENVKISMDRVRQYNLPSNHINYTTYFRYFIADYVEEDRVLYLDSDIVVTGDLSELFLVDLQGFPIAAVPDFPTRSDYFNAGILVLDTDWWRSHPTVQELLDITEKYQHEVYGDQGVLNRYFENNWLALPLTYNLQVGSDFHQFLLGDTEWYQRFQGVPKIIHYTTENKPWKRLRFNRFREMWWFYYGLSWDDVLLRKEMVKLDFNSLIHSPKFQTAIFTNSASMAHLEELIQAFPEVQFNILAHSYFAPNVMELERYLNVAIYPSFDPLTHQRILAELDFYLDINYENEIVEITHTVEELGKPIFAFSDTSHSQSGNSHIFDPHDIAGMISEISEYLSSKKMEY